MSLYQVLCLAGVPTLVGIIIALVIKRPLDRRVQAAETSQATQQQQSQAIMLGVRALLRDRLLQGYKHYLEKGWADPDDRSNMENIWKQYHALGGNGDMKDLRRTFRHLPLIPGGNPMEVSDEE